MNHSGRASSAPLISSERSRKDAAISCASTNDTSEKPRLKYTPRSPGFLNHDNSIGRWEFQDSKRGMDELKDFARTTPPDRVLSQPTIERKSMAGLSRTDSGRRRRILESIADSDSLPSKQLRRLLYRLNRSATTSDLTQNNLPRGSIEIASKESSGGRKYMKIAVNSKLYESENPSTYKVNFQDLKVKKEGQKRFGRRSKARTALETDTSEISGQDSHLLDDTDDYCKKVKDEYPHLILGSEISQPAKAVINQTNNGYSPSKGIPKPELGPNIRDSAAATLAIAQAHARRAGQVSLPPGKLDLQARQRESHVRNHGNHGDRMRASSKGPYSVPIKFQMRPQWTSLPKTPRTSLDEPSKLKDTSPVVNGKPKASSTISGTDSCADDVQSEIDPGEIMNAQSAEVIIHGQGTFGYHSRTSNKPPRSGPAPTRALPSLPEGHDNNTTANIINTESNGPLATTSRPAPGASPKSKKATLPPKGHRYRLSPIKNNICKDTSCPALELRPSPKFTEEFPQPPSSLVPVAPRRSRESSPALRNREVDVTQVMTGLRVDTQGFIGTAASSKTNEHQDATNGKAQSPSARSTSPRRRSTDPDKNNLYIPWQESRVERVKALKARDMKRLRSRQDSAISPRSKNGNSDMEADARANSDAAERKESSQFPSLLIQGTEGSHFSTQPNSINPREHFPLTAQNAMSPVITIASNPPSIPLQPHPSASNLNPNHLNHRPSPKATPILRFSTHGSLDPNIHPNGSPSPATAGRQEPSSRPHSHHSYTSLPTHSSYTAELEARIAAMEKKNLLLERAFMAVIDATSGFGSMGNGRGSGMSASSGFAPGLGGRDDGCERESWGTQGGLEVDRQKAGGRSSAASDGLGGLGRSEGRVENMLMEMQAKMGQLG